MKAGAVFNCDDYCSSEEVCDRKASLNPIFSCFGKLNLLDQQNMMFVKCECLISYCNPFSGVIQTKSNTGTLLLRDKTSKSRISVSQKKISNYSSVLAVPYIQSSLGQKGRALGTPREQEKKVGTRSGKKEHHLWQRRDSAQSGQKALSLVRIVSELPHEKEAVYGALDKWTAWETEFPLISAAKALKILRKRRQWVRVIQVAKWMLSKGQGATLGTYDTLLLAFDMDQRVDEAESLWNMILHAHTRSLSKRLFSRMIALYDHHNLPDKIIEVFADMEELRIRPDEDTVRRVARAFGELNQKDKQKLVIKRYGLKWKYIHFNGERVKVRTEASNEDEDGFRNEISCH